MLPTLGTTGVMLTALLAGRWTPNCSEQQGPRGGRSNWPREWFPRGNACGEDGRELCGERVIVERVIVQRVIVERVIVAHVVVERVIVAHARGPRHERDGYSYGSHSGGGGYGSQRTFGRGESGPPVGAEFRLIVEQDRKSVV